MNREVFLAERKSGVGGSDIAAMLGLSPYRTPLQLWMDKTGRAEDAEPNDDARERMHFGSLLEGVVASEYSARTGSQVQRVNAILRHPECQIALANIDRAVLQPGSRARWDEKSRRLAGADAILECKTAHELARNSGDWGDAGTDNVPEAYWLQTQWYMGITSLPRADLACLFGGRKLVIYTIAADRDLFADLIQEAQRWWQEHVVADVPPQPRTEDDARRLWRSHVAGREKVVDVTIAEAVQAMRELRDQARALEEREQQLRDRITCAFGDAESISYMGRSLATWKRNRGGQRTDWRAVAAEAGATPEQIASHTTTTEGARVLRLATPKETTE